jgi:DNA-3-methyladenine glycosylase II
VVGVEGENLPKAQDITLNDETLIIGTDYLALHDTAMHFVLQKYGYPPLWARKPGFATLCHMILEQQVSLASANAAFKRLEQLLADDVTPARFLEIAETDLQAIGYSRQKINYTRGLAQAILQNEIDLEALQNLPDDAVRTELCKLKGIGNWTADIYLSECLMRSDILPPGDIAVLEAFKVLKGLETRPVHALLVEMTEHWRPWRSIGVRMLWHFYLSEKAQKKLK